jgi:large conductance mechanosensitive channel
MLKEFKEFAMRGNMIDLAVGIVIGGAFGKIIASLVGDIMMPIVNPLIPGGDWKTIQLGPGIKLGSFVGTVIDFIIVALTIFLIIKALNQLQKKKEIVPPPPSKEEVLLTEIRDLLKNKQT